MIGKATALRQKIKAFREEQKHLSKLETEGAFEIQRLIRQQAILEDEIIAAECELATLRVKHSKVPNGGFNIMKILL